MVDCTHSYNHWRDSEEQGWENKMAEEQMDVGYTSLHGYIRNTLSDTEVHAEHQLREDRNT